MAFNPTDGKNKIFVLHYIEKLDPQIGVCSGDTMGATDKVQICIDFAISSDSKDGREEGVARATRRMAYNSALVTVCASPGKRAKRPHDTC